jgi:hypothetical protein
MTKRKQDWPCGEKVRVQLDIGVPGKKTAVHSELVDEAYSMYSELLPRSRSKEQLLEWKIFGVVELATLLWMRIKKLERCNGE